MILVTGGAGYIGSHTCLQLLEAGEDVVVVDNLSNSSQEALVRVAKLAGRALPLIQADVCDRPALQAVFEAHPIKAVIHFAGLKAVGESVKAPLAYYRNNLDSTLSLCETMQAFGVTRLVFSSSATVYGTAAQSPIAEEAPLAPTNPYGWTKAMNEQLLRDLARANPAWSVLLLRYFNPVGAHASGLIGEDPLGVPNNLMPALTQVAVGRRQAVHVFGQDYETVDGTGVRDYIHVEDLARGHVLALKALEGLQGAHAINLGTGNGYSVLTLIRAFEQASGCKLPLVMAPRRRGCGHLLR